MRARIFPIGKAASPAIAGCSRATPPVSSIRFSAAAFSSPSSPANKCADILDIVLDHPRKAARLFAQYERLLRRVMNGYLRFVDAWYSKEFIEVFLYPQDVLQIPPAVNAVLGGNISGSFAIRWRMSALLFHRLAATLPAALPAPHARRANKSTRRRPDAALRSLTTWIMRRDPMWRCLLCPDWSGSRKAPPHSFLFRLLCLTSCETLRHQFVQPESGLAVAGRPTPISRPEDLAHRRSAGPLLERGRLRADLQQRSRRHASDCATGRQVRPGQWSSRPRLVVRSA